MLDLSQCGPYDGTRILDVSKNINLTGIVLETEGFEYINLENGIDSSILNFTMEDMYNLQCIQVDNVDTASTKWPSYQSYFSENCGY